MKPKSLKRNVLFAGVTNFSDLFVFALMVLAGRELGKEGFGAFSYAQALSMMFLMFVNFGLNPLVVRDVARNHALASRYLFNVLWWKGVLAIVSYLVLVASLFWVVETTPEVRTAILFIAGAVAMRFFSMTARTLLRAFERFDVESLGVFVEQILLVGIGATVLFRGGGIVQLAMAFFVARLLGAVFVSACVLRIVPLRWEFDPQLMMRLQMKALPIGIAGFVTTAYLHIDTLILKQMVTMGEVGQYNAALKVFIGSLMLPSIICQVWLPRLSTSYEEDKHKHNRILIVGMLALLVMGCAVALVGVFVAGPLMRGVFGPEFDGSVEPMRILFVVCILTFQIWFLRTFLVAVNRQRMLVVFSVAGLSARVGFNLLLIPRYGINGAAIATGLAELTVFASIWFYLAIWFFKVRRPRDLLVRYTRKHKRETGLARHFYCLLRPGQEMFFLIFSGFRSENDIIKIERDGLATTREGPVEPSLDAPEVSGGGDADGVFLPLVGKRDCVDFAVT